jgi:chaperone required for assembly of F1-ATPase
VTAWAPRRFWTTADIAPLGDGFGVLLDGKPVRTPRKAPLVLPTEGLARAVADEWQAVEGKVDPARMPFTRRANSVIDMVVPKFDAVADLIADYGGSDLIAYRAEGPEALVARQAEAWDPLLDWAAADLGAPLKKTVGVIHIAQPDTSLMALRRAVRALTPFQLAAVHDLVTLSGSLVLALAAARGKLPPEAAWSLGRIDEAWQIDEWGEDAEAAETARLKREDFLAAYRFFALCAKEIAA